MFKKILVPVDGSEGSWRALDTAVELGKKFGGELHVINVIQPYNNAALLAVPLDHATVSQGNSELEKIGDKGNTPLTLDGQGWSMKYNLLWDKVLGLGLMPESFYAAETASYLPRINTYGLPLDSRADYTKSDWICWTARMADDAAVRTALIAPIAKELRETTSRVPFSDWYDTKTGRYVAFIARSVQGGIFALML